MPYASPDRHQQFLSDLDDSVDAVAALAAYFVRRGHGIYVPGLRKAPEHSQHREYSDSGGDLYVNNLNGVQRTKIDVKCLGVNFTGEDDWPYWPNFIVNSRYSYDMASPKPHYYYILSNNKTHAGIVSVKTTPSWRIEDRRDYRDGRMREFYLCPMECVEFVKIC